MSYTPEIILQYGLAGVALFMMYQITYNHLQAIHSELVDIRILLEKSIND